MGDSPDSPVVKMLASRAPSVGSVPGQGTKIHMPHSGAKNQKQTKTNKQKNRKRLGVPY